MKIPRSLHLPWAKRHSLSVSSNRCSPWPKVCKALWATSSCQRFALFLSQHFFFLMLLFLLVFFCIQQCWTDSQLLQLFYKISILMHLEEYITATNKFTIEVHLWDGRPVGVVFYSWIRKKQIIRGFPSLLIEWYFRRNVLLPPDSTTDIPIPFP